MKIDTNYKWAFLISIVVIQMSCTRKTPYSGNLFPIAENGKMGYIDSSGTVKIKPVFDFVGKFHEGLAVAVIDSNYGYINKTGNWIIKPKLSLIQHLLWGTSSPNAFSSKKTIDSIHSNFKAFLKTKRDTIYPYNLSQDFNFKDGLVVIYESGKGYGYINKTGDTIIKPQFSSANNFSEGLACVSVTETLFINKYGFIDRSGKFVIQPTYDFASSFSEGKASVYLSYKNEIKKGSKATTTYYNSKTLVINQKNQILFEADAQKVYRYRNGYAVCYNMAYASLFGRGYNYIDSTGKLLMDYGKGSFVDCNYTSDIKDWGATDSTKGDSYLLLLVKTHALNSFKWGFIKPDLTSPFGTSPKEIFKFDDAHPFSDNIALVKLDGLWGFLEPSGNFVIKAKYDMADDFHHGLAYVEQKSGNLTIYGYINKQGILVWHNQQIKG